MTDKKTLKRTDAALRSKKALLEKEHQEFVRIRKHFELLGERLESSQKSYLAGVRKINEIRKSSLRTNLATMEAGVDATKKDWVSAYRERQVVSQHLEKQRHLVLRMQQQVRDFQERCEQMEKNIKEDESRKEDKEITGLSQNYRFNLQKKQE